MDTAAEVERFARHGIFVAILLSCHRQRDPRRSKVRHPHVDADHVIAFEMQLMDVIANLDTDDIVYVAAPSEIMSDAAHAVAAMLGWRAVGVIHDIARIGGTVRGRQ